MAHTEPEQVRSNVINRFQQSFDGQVRSDFVSITSALETGSALYLSGTTQDNEGRIIALPTDGSGALEYTRPKDPRALEGTAFVGEVGDEVIACGWHMSDNQFIEADKRTWCVAFSSLP